MQFVWEIILKLGVWWLDSRGAEIERKKAFLEWVGSHNEKAKVPAGLSQDWKDALADLENRKGDPEI